MAKKEDPNKVNKRNAAQKKQMYLQRAANTAAAKLTGRGREVLRDPNKYLTAAELAEYKPRKKDPNKPKKK